MKDINLEINKLEAIKYEVDQLEMARKIFVASVLKAVADK